MDSKGERTRERILQTAENIILGKGFSGTSIDEIIAESGITKGGFFYHFDGKNDLAVHLIRRYRVQDEKILGSFFERAADLSEDPVQRVLIAVKLFAETMSNLPGLHPGCLVASFTYESQIFDPEVRDLIRKGVLEWRELFGKHFAAAKAASPKATNVDTEQLADMFSTVIEGGIVLSRALNDPKILPQQILLFRSYLKTLFI